MSRRYQKVIAPFGLNHLQSFVVLADLAEREGYTLAEFADTVRADIAARMSDISGHTVAQPRPPERRICPSCGRGKMIPVITRDTTRVEGCRICRYSEVVP